MSVFKEFREFALKGSVVDLAVGVIIGAAFGTIVSSLVDDIIMPLIGAATGGLDFSNYFVALSPGVTETTLEAAREQGAVFAYGKFLTAVLKFVIVAWVLFLVIKGMNTLKRNQAAGPPPPPAEIPADVKLLTEIRDLLKSTQDEAIKETNRPFVRKDWKGRGITLHISLPDGDFLVPHDALLEWALTNKNVANTESWDRGLYSWPKVPQDMTSFLQDYKTS